MNTRLFDTEKKYHPTEILQSKVIGTDALWLIKEIKVPKKTTLKPELKKENEPKNDVRSASKLNLLSWDCARFIDRILFQVATQWVISSSSVPPPKSVKKKKKTKELVTVGRKSQRTAELDIMLR